MIKSSCKLMTPEGYKIYWDQGHNTYEGADFLGKKIKSIERVEKKRARVALESLRGFVKTINTQRPDLSDPNVKLMYEATKLKHKPGKSNI